MWRTASDPESIHPFLQAVPSPSEVLSKCNLVPRIKTKEHPASGTPFKHKRIENSLSILFSRLCALWEQRRETIYFATLNSTLASFPVTLSDKLMA